MANYNDEPVSDAEFDRQLKERKEQKKVNEAAKKAESTYAKGGYVKAADGIAKKGKTKGKMV